MMASTCDCYVDAGSGLIEWSKQTSLKRMTVFIHCTMFAAWARQRVPGLLGHEASP